ncbi:tetratricopeptide repeat protein [Streptomyces sp. NPDC004788]
MAYGGDCQIDQALHHAQAALDLQPLTGTGRRRPAILVNSMADALREAGRYAEAELHYREALASWREQGAAANVAITLSNLGDALRGLGRREEALGAFQEALDISERTGNVADSCDFLVVMARAHVQFGEWAEARARARQALDLADRHQLGCRLNEAHEVLATIESAREKEH